MKNKLISLAAVICMLMSWLVIPTTAAGNVQTEVTADEYVIITNQVVNYEIGNGLRVNFDISTTLAEDNPAEVEVKVFDNAGNKLAGAFFEKILNSAAAEPIEFSSTLPKGDNLRVEISATLPEIGRIYVAADGSDLNDGSKNAPLKTLGAAVTKTAANNEPASIVMREGTYSTEAVTISGANDLEIKGEGNVTLVGGITIKGSDMTKVTDATELAMFPEAVRSNLYRTTIANYDNTLDPIYTGVYVDGEEQQIARFPNLNDGMSETATTVWDDWDKASKSGFAFTSSAIKAWQNTDYAWVRGNFYADWDLAVCSGITAENGTIAAEKAMFGSLPDTPPVKTDRPWYIYNLPEELDIEGEYVIYGETLYYCPKSENAADFSNAEIIISSESEDLLTVSSSSDVTIENISFQYAKGAFINATSNVNNLSILGCEFANNSNADRAVEIFGDNNLVSSCDFHDIGGRGIVFGGGDMMTLTDSGSVLKNCSFERTGQISRTNKSAVLLKGCGVEMRNNYITQTPHAALAYNGNNHLIEYNEITNCLTDEVADAGIIYVGADISNLGTVIQYNYIHDSYVSRAAIYWDDRLSGQTAQYNVIENIDRALFIHGGVCNTFANNYVVNSASKGTVSSPAADGLCGAIVRGKGRTATLKALNEDDPDKDADGNITINVWSADDAERYNIYGNVFLGRLIGIRYNLDAYPAKPWQEETWQTAYGDVLKYINNKTDDLANETSVTNNTFVNVDYPIFCAQEMSGKTLEYAGGSSTGNVTEATAEATALYNDVTARAGLYADIYRSADEI